MLARTVSVFVGLALTSVFVSAEMRSARMRTVLSNCRVVRARAFALAASPIHGRLRPPGLLGERLRRSCWSRGVAPLRASSADRTRAARPPARRAGAHHARAALRRRHRRGGHGPAVVALP